MKSMSPMVRLLAMSFLWIGCATTTRLGVDRELRTGIEAQHAVASRLARVS